MKDAGADVKDIQDKFVQEFNDYVIDKHKDDGKIDAKFALNKNKFYDTLPDKRYEVDQEELEELTNYVLYVNDKAKSKFVRQGIKEVGNNFYLYYCKNRSEFKIVDYFPIEGNEDEIDKLRSMGIKNGIFKNATSFADAIRISEYEQSRNNIHNHKIRQSEQDRRNGGLDSEE